MTDETPKNSQRRGAKGLSEELGLPPYMEAIRRRGGGYSYRVRGKDKNWISVGWNLNEALERYKEIRGTTWRTDSQEAIEVFQRAIKGAKRRGIEFDITQDDVQAMLERQNYRCAITQKPFNNRKPAGQRNRPWAASLDRIDSSRGYSVENCRLVCTFVNVALNNYGDGLYTELLEHMVRRVVQEELRKLGLYSKVF
jgi:hypothetical protein